MQVKRAHHVSFGVRDLARAQEFYGGILGLPQIARPDFGIPGAWYRAGEIEVHLIQVPEGVDIGSRAEKLTPLAGHAAFEIEDYVAARDELQEKGVALLETGAEMGQLFFRDPDHNVIELIRPGGARSGRPRS